MLRVLGDKVKDLFLLSKKKKTSSTLSDHLKYRKKKALYKKAIQKAS